MTPEEQISNNNVKKYRKAMLSKAAIKYPISPANRDKNADVFPPIGSVAAAESLKNI